MKTRYHIEVACSKTMRNVLIAGLLSCLVWTGILGVFVVQPVWAQSWAQRAELKIDEHTRQIGEIQVQFASMAGEVRALVKEVGEAKTQIAAVQATQWQTLLGVLGLLVTAVLGLMGVLWNLRSGWLTVKADEGGDE